MDALFLRDAADQPRLLIIEPNRSYLGVFARRLAPFGFRIATALNVHDGLAEMQRMPVDLVLCAVRMPGTGGIELVRMLREDPVQRYLPVILLGGRSDGADLIKAFDAGADGVIRKPFDFAVVAARLRREIDRSHAIARLRADNAALDARITSRAIELGELRAALAASEAERRRLGVANAA
ncbi:response regulator [Sphingomonas sinipercae]|uniref:Response regulator n=1 Tax=Sphingomonas sinipercae TaxID=2714944 RepID=A0A6G7ZL54_9SPHN|nr:response regulator [Sphingomonas sinipercae]QIL01655.1 response regulator [Sphingomonas sinipercae]